MKYIKIAAGLAHVDYGQIGNLVKQASDAGADYIHSDAADMNDLQNMKLMGGWQIVEGIRPYTDKPIEVHFYSIKCDKMFIEQIADAGASMLIIPAERFIGAELAYIIAWCREKKMKVGLTIGCYTPLSFVEESIYDIDRLHVVTHGQDEDGSEGNWMWRRSVKDLIVRARKLIDNKNPKCELALDGGLRHDNLTELVELNPDVIVFSSGIFKHKEGVAAGVNACRKNINALSQKYKLK